MSENTPHDHSGSEDSQATGSDPWAEVTDSIGSTRADDQSADVPGQEQAHDDHEKAGARTEQVRDDSQKARAVKEQTQVDVEKARAAREYSTSEEASDEAVAGKPEAGRPETPDAEKAPPASTPSGASTDDHVREILAEVAAGRLPPDQAAVLIDQARTSGPTSEPAGETAATAGVGEAGASESAVAAVAAPTTTRLRVRAVGRRVRIIGEPFVSTVAVDGPHVVRQEGDTLVVTSEGEFGASIDGFTLMRTRSWRDVQERVFDLGRELSVRVNPNLAVEVEVTAGSVNAERLPALEQVRVTAGSARVRDVDGPIDLLVQAGSAQVEGKISKGRSRLRVESGSLQLRLLPGSSVRIRPDVQLGRVQWEPPGRDREEHIVGLGDALLNLDVVMGTATVKEAP